LQIDDQKYWGLDFRWVYSFACLLSSEQRPDGLLKWRPTKEFFQKGMGRRGRSRFIRDEPGFVMFMQPKARKLDKRKLSRGIFS